MALTRRGLIGSAVATSFAGSLASPAHALDQTIRIGVLNDQTGPYKDFGGPGSVAAARQAVRDFGNQGFSVEVISADHQNKPDVGAAIARQWCDAGALDLITGLSNSSVALAVNSVVREKNKALITTSVGTVDLTGPQCSPNTVQWTFDVYMLSKAAATAVVRKGGDTWYIIYADYVFGQQLTRYTTRFVTAGGGKVLGSVKYPFPGTSDFSSFLLQGQGKRRQRRRLCQHRRRSRQLHKTGARVPLAKNDAARRVGDVYHRRARHRAQRRSRHHFVRAVLLGSERSHTVLHPASPQGPKTSHLSYHGSRRLLCGRTTLFEGGC